MGNPKAFLTIPRQEAGYRPVHDRINDFGEVEQTLNTSERKQQASRCMDCGVPFCHWACPLGNRPPEFQDALYKGKWKEAYEILSQTNDFPEFTGRICPALCEKSCVLKLAIDAPVTIREDEAAIIEAAFREGYIKPRTYPRNGKKVAVVGSGPAGMAAANQLNRMGYEVTVFEKDEYVGGLLRFGIPNFKLNKAIIDRRVDIMAAEGITFKTSTPIDVEHLPEGFDAYCICTGTPQARDLDIPGRPQRHTLRIGNAGPTKPRPGRTGIQQGRTHKRQRQTRVGHRWRRHGKRLHRYKQPTGCGQYHANRNHAETSSRAQPGHTMAAMARGIKNQFQSRRGLHTPVEPDIQPFYRHERRPSLRCGSGRSGMDSQPGRRPPRHAPYREKGNPQGRPRAVGHGIPQTPTAGVRKQRFRGRRRGHRCQPRSPLHRRRTQSSPRHQRLLN